MRKQTKLWRTRDGTKIRICDMTDSHLCNAIRMVERVSVAATWEAIHEAEIFEGMMQGEMASFAVQQEINHLLKVGISPDEITPLYDNLVWEAERRDLTVER